MTDTNRFDEIAATWDDDPRRVQTARAVAQEITRQLRLSPDMDLLDFGCGTGLLTLALAPHARSVTGVDTSPGMLDVLRQKLERHGIANVTTAALDPQQQLSLGARFDLVVSSMALHHVADPAALFGAFRDHLRPGGRVALADLDREDGTFHEDARGVFHLGFDRAEFQSWLAAAGFVELGATTATVVRKEKGEYPVFLVTARRA